jgi:hypothetical protein
MKLDVLCVSACPRAHMCLCRVQGPVLMCLFLFFSRLFPASFPGCQALGHQGDEGGNANQ